MVGNLVRYLRNLGLIFTSLPIPDEWEIFGNVSVNCCSKIVKYT